MSRHALRLTALAAALSYGAVFVPMPALAVSTTREVQIGQQEDKQIVRQYDVLTDPLLNRWVADIGNRLWSETARKDVPYNFKILDVSDVNAFSTVGGYVYLDAGTLDFVQSDDELAGVIGHETGHIERRHGVTFSAKAQILDLLFGVASLLSPFASGIGQVAEAGVLAKVSRTQELQADQYGLQLMSRAGYDPEAMVSFMKHLGAVHDEQDDSVDKYLADHPGFPDRVAHLLGYSELDPNKRTKDQLLVQALRNRQTARYTIAARELQRIVKADPSNADALLALGTMQIALGFPNKGEQSLTEASEKGTPALRAAAMKELELLRESQTRSLPTYPDLASFRRRLDDAFARQAQTAKEIALLRNPARDHLKALDARLKNLSNEAPDLAGAQDRPNSRIAAVTKELTAMIRFVNSAGGKSKSVIDGIGSLEKNKESGMLKENVDILSELQAPLKLDVLPAQARANIPNYPDMLSDIDCAADDMLRALDASQSALTLLDTGLNGLDDLFHSISRLRIEAGSDMTRSDYDTLLPLISRAKSSLEKAAAGGARAWQMYNLARSRQVQTRISMLGLGFSKDRYATLQYALLQRVKSSGLDYDTMIRENLTPGEVVAATTIAADTGVSPQDIVNEAKRTGRHIIDVADARGMSAYSLEIFIGLVYLDYTDDPELEAHQSTGRDEGVSKPALTER